MGGSSLEIVSGQPPRVGPWQIATTLGTSSWCTVYLAQDRQKRWAALKMPLFERMGDPRVAARFRKEVEVARALKHPGFIKVLDARPDDPIAPWVAFEACEGGTLGGWLDSHGAMPAFQVIEVGARLLSALSAAHQLGVVQRRLGPDDVLLDRSGACRLADFQRVATQALPSDSVDVENDVHRVASLMIALLAGTRGATSPPEGIAGSLRDALIKGTAKGRGQGYPNPAAMGRDLEVAMLEVSVPSGAITPLVPEDVALPDALESLFDPDASFHDLSRFSRWIADPAAGPPKVDSGPSSLYSRLAPAVSAAKGPRRPATTRPRTPPRSLVPLPPDAGLSAPRPASSPASRKTSPSGGLQPSYLVEEEETVRDESWRQATPRPVRREQGPSRGRMDPWVLMALVALVLLLVGGVVGRGAYGVRSARLAAQEAAENLTAVVEAEAAVVNDLVALGADRALLEGLFFAYTDSRGAERYRAAEQFARALRSEAERLGVDPAQPKSANDEAVARVQKVLVAQERYGEGRQRWAEVAHSFPGTIAVTLGLSRTP